MRKKLMILGFALVAAAGIVQKPAAAHPGCPVGTYFFVCTAMTFGCCPVGMTCSCN